jgi:Carbohydrate esterase, sialic acid-specific acetylesterase
MLRFALYPLLAMAALTTLACSDTKKDDDAAGGTGGTGQSGAGARATGGAPVTGDPNFHVYLLIGQSNMEGQPKPEAADRAIESRVKVLQYDDCTNFARKYDQWYTAIPPLHSCFAGVGPGDYFGKTLAAAYPEATIGLVPCAISGVDIDMFRKGVVPTTTGREPTSGCWSARG